MSGMFGSTSKLPAQDQRAFGIQTQRANTNQQARPIPLLYGKQRLGVTFISDVFDLLASPVTQSVGKQSEQVGNNFYASFAALVCYGPVDGLHDIFLNGEPVYTSQTLIYAVSLTSTGTSGQLFYTATFQSRNPHGLPNGATLIILGADQPEYNGEFTITVVSANQFQYFIAPTDASTATSNQAGAITSQVRLDPVFRDATNPDFVEVTIPDYGIMTLRWGTETQAQDDYLNTKSGVKHPAYRGMCYIVFHQLFFGFNQTNVPNIEIVLSRKPLPGWASLPTGSVQEDANPSYIIADLFQNTRSGLALLDEEIDTAGLDAAAEGFANEQLGVSQPISRAQDLRSLLTTLCETIDALPGLNGLGLLSLLPVRPPVDVGALPVIGDGDLIELPQFAPQDWTTTYTTTSVNFANAELDYQDDSRTWRDGGTLNVIRNPDQNALERRWITRADLAQIMANVAGQAAAIPGVMGRLKVRYSDALFAQLAPGSMFQLNYSLRSTENLIFRVTSRSVPGPDLPEIDIEFQADRTYLYSALSGGGGGGEARNQLPHVPPIVQAPANTRLLLFELPAGLCPGVPAIGALVARGSTALVSFSIYLAKNYAWSGAAPESYGLVTSKSRFAFHGFLEADYSATTRLIDLERGLTVQLDGPDVMLEPITAFEALANTVLCFIDDEILSLAGWSLLDSGLYRLQVIRGRFGTPIQEHETGARILIVNKSDLPIVTAPQFQPDNIARLKITLGGQSSAEAEAISVSMEGIAWRVPPPLALAVNARSFNPVFPGGAAALTLSWVLPDAGGLLPRFDLVKIWTRLEFYIAAGADSDTTGDSDVLTADGGPLDLNTMELVHTQDIPWPMNSVDVVFADVTGAPDQNFLIVARTIADTGWKKVCSSTVARLQVIKYP